MSEENDFDLYGDLDGTTNEPETHDDNFGDELKLLSPVKVQKCTKSDKSSGAEMKELQEKLEILQKQLDNEIGKNEKVKNNFTIMLQTARSEIQRKDYQIHMLNKAKDDVVFRRNRPDADQELENARRRDLQQSRQRSKATQTDEVKDVNQTRKNWTFDVDTQTDEFRNEYRIPPRSSSSSDFRKDRGPKLKTHHHELTRTKDSRHDSKKPKSEHDRIRKRSRSRSPTMKSDHKRRRHSDDERTSDKSKSKSKNRKDVDLRETLLKNRLSKEVTRTVHEITRRSMERQKSCESEPQVAKESSVSKISCVEAMPAVATEPRKAPSEKKWIDQSEPKKTEIVEDKSETVDKCDEIKSSVNDEAQKKNFEKVNGLDKTDSSVEQLKLKSQQENLTSIPEPPQLPQEPEFNPPEPVVEDGEVEDGEIVDDDSPKKIEMIEIIENKKEPEAVSESKPTTNVEVAKVDEVVIVRKKKSKLKKKEKTPSPVKIKKVKRSPTKPKVSKLESPKKKSVKSSKVESNDKKVLNGNRNWKSPRKQKSHNGKSPEKVQKSSINVPKPSTSLLTEKANSSPSKSVHTETESSSTVELQQVVELSQPLENSEILPQCDVELTPNSSEQLSSPTKLNGSSHDALSSSINGGGSSRENSFTNKRKSLTAEVNEDGIAVFTITRHKKKKKPKSQDA